LPQCITVGTGYYISSLSFDQPHIKHCTVRMRFIGAAPAWVRVYECSQSQNPVLVKSLTPDRRSDDPQDPDCWEYVDVIQDAPGQSSRVYMFWRASV
jgi:hypothetical protein